MAATLDSPERAFGILPALEGAAQGVLGEACARLEDGISIRGPPSTDNVVGEAPFIETVVVPLLSPR